MPAWGKSMDDQYIWGIVAFLDHLPQLDAQQYKTLVAASGGHQHGGGESEMHNHEGQHGENVPVGTEHHSKPAQKTHLHRDGKAHTHQD
ncbi:hypothetical protein D3C81_1283490 [compost metagenome]